MENAIMDKVYLALMDHVAYIKLYHIYSCSYFNNGRYNQQQK